MIKDIRAITYRGVLKSCNYSCDYCPFAKRKGSLKEIEQDKRSLEKFEEYVSKCLWSKKVSILIAPYGEALHHKHYQEMIGRVSRLEAVDLIGIQTNFSLSVEELLESLCEQEANLDKIRLWCTYHPSMVTMQNFITQVYKIYTSIKICVGVVGVPEQISSIETLRKLLPDDIYLWINAMDGLIGGYSKGESECLRKIDPLFSYEGKKYKCDSSLCDAGKNSVFIAADGTVYPCNRNRNKLGNLYEGIVQSQEVSAAGSCDCYLSYCHRYDLPSLPLLGIGRPVRIPQTIDCQGLFLDIDGTLTKNGTISEEVKAALETIAADVPIYVATMRPYQQARRCCRTIWHLLSGGIFAGGADRRDFPLSLCEITELDLVPSSLIANKVYVYKQDDKVYKITVLAKNTDEIKALSEELARKYRLLVEGRVISITDQSCSKLNGIRQLCDLHNWKKERVITVGNSHEDCEMLSFFPYSVAVSNATIEVKRAAYCSMSIPALPAYMGL